MGGLAEDRYTNALNTIDYGHHEIHTGNHYFVVDAVDQAINTVYDITIVTPNTRKWAHLLWDIVAENEHSFFIYEDATIINAGTLVTIHNSNRNSSNTSGLVLRSQVNSSVANANADTSVAAATELEHGIFSGRGLSLASSRDFEIVLKQNTTYCFRGIFTAAGFLSFSMNWYEHTNKVYDATQGGI